MTGSKREHLAQVVHYLYILRSIKDGGLYTGCTHDIVERWAYHSKGRSAATKHRLPMELVYVESFPDRRRALARERQLKSLEGGPEKFGLVASQTPDGIAELQRRWLGRVHDSGV